MRSLIAARAGLNASDAECIDYLLEMRSATASELAMATGLSKSAITSLVERLERAGYVTRDVAIADKRKVIIRPVLQTIYASFAAYYRPVTDGFNNIVASYTLAEMTFLKQHYTHMKQMYDEQVKNLNDPNYNP